MGNNYFQELDSKNPYKQVKLKLENTKKGFSEETVSLQLIKELKDYVYIPHPVEQLTPLDEQTRKVRDALRHGCKISDYERVSSKLDMKDCKINEIIALETTNKKFAYPTHDELRNPV